MKGTPASSQIIWLEDRVKALEAEVERLTHNTRVLTDAVWKACGDDDEVVKATIESQGTLQ